MHRDERDEQRYRVPVCQAAKPVRGARTVAIVSHRAWIMCSAGLRAAPLLPSAHTCMSGVSTLAGSLSRSAGTSSAGRSAMTVNVANARGRA